ncbi:sulfatase-like hydrolase/transferase [Paenibacillus mendelii]|uniref:Sulfatase-like hydrolase/transferase n=1 Tax=Paenibacillus mendelii TaxID=206163 RepID=A0ABV6JDN5_9BACL|nr:sulfatase-like hydrolase/transferase [Paenibacillus mendelii]MCQ6563820.1 sulfatase-like hydrolase/transferase [Paenibacillus mendelii]
MNSIVIVCDTLRRDHCGPYHNGRPLNQVVSAEQPDWVIPTPNMDRLAQRGIVFDNAYCGSTPCMPARRDIYTGRYEFLERGWGPLEDDDLDLPRQISGPPNSSLNKQLDNGNPVSYFITDHFHMWEQGAGNYHMGYTGFEFIRGHEADAWRTDPVEFPCPESEKNTKLERHFRNVHLTRKSEEDYFCAQIFSKAADWLEANHTHDDFYLHLDCFDPHEPWDPPEEYVKMFDPRGYDVDRFIPQAPYDEWNKHMTEQQKNHVQACYAANVVLVDKWLGKLLDKMDELDLWSNTMLIFTTDHGTYNGDHGRTGKLQTHQYDAVAHIPFIVAYPGGEQGVRRDQLVQLVDIYPTVLRAAGKPCPPDRHGLDLTPVLESGTAPLRDYAISGMFGRSVTITDGRWTLHQSPNAENQPLYWYGTAVAKFIPYDLGPYVDGKRLVSDCASWPTPTWLSDKSTDPSELVNLADQEQKKAAELQQALKQTLVKLQAPSEQLERLGLQD